MAFASHTLFFALSHLLLLLLLIHESQSCPNSISFDCPDHAYSNGHTSLDFPFTNSSLPGCGICTLTCENNYNHTMINCVGWNPDAHYQALDINPSKHTIVVGYPHPCEAYTYSDASFPKTPSVSFTILQGLETVFVCPYENGSPKWDDQPFQICDDDKHIVYGPYKHPQPPKTLSPPPPECSLKNNSFSIQYNISSQCQRCLNEGGQCYNEVFHGEVYCNHRNMGKELRLQATTIPISSIKIVIFEAVT